MDSIVPCDLTSTNYAQVGKYESIMLECERNDNPLSFPVVLCGSVFPPPHADSLVDVDALLQVDYQ